MPFLKYEQEFRNAERKAVAGITRIFENAFHLASIPIDPYSIDISREFRRPATTLRIRRQIEPIFFLGTRQADEVIKHKGAAVSSEFLIEGYTQYVITGLAFVAEDMKTDLTATLQEGYKRGESIPKLSRRILALMELNRSRATNLSRTVTNDVYNQAHFTKYQESSVVQYLQYSAHLDERTSPICRMLNGTIWHKNSQELQRPPAHFRCRSRLVPYFGSIPGERDYTKWTDGTEVSPETVANLMQQSVLFRSKYWKIPFANIQE